MNFKKMYINLVNNLLSIFTEQFQLNEEQKKFTYNNIDFVPIVRCYYKDKINQCLAEIQRLRGEQQ